MVETIQERVGVLVLYYEDQPLPLPHKIKWRDRYYTIHTVDLCHPAWEGKTLHYIYSVSDGRTYFRLNLNTRSQLWTLEEVSDGLPA